MTRPSTELTCFSMSHVESKPLSLLDLPQTSRLDCFIISFNSFYWIDLSLSTVSTTTIQQECKAHHAYTSNYSSCLISVCAHARPSEKRH